MKSISLVYSPVYAAFLLLYGKLFAFAGAHFIGAPWQRPMTIVFYVVLLLYSLFAVWRLHKRLLPFTTIDVIFAAFFLLVLASLVLQGGLHVQSGKHYEYFLPFMVIAPYLCGKVMRDGDIERLSRIVVFAGLGVLPLLLLDRIVSPPHGSTRWPVFGYDHVALLAGALLAASVLALCVRGVASRKSADDHWTSMALEYALIGVLTGTLVWTLARGWLLATIAGLTVVAVKDCWRCGLRSTYLRYLCCVAAVMMLSMAVLPRPSGQFYASLLTAPAPAPASASAPAPAPAPVDDIVGPILGEASCLPLTQNVNSVAIRWVLYREAVAMFMQSPIWGVGASRFGERSCTGPGWYPHSTVLQAFSELGVIGGGTLLGLLWLTARTLMRHSVVEAGLAYPVAGSFALALFSAFFVSDQFRGNYFMATGMCLMFGIAAGLSAQDKGK